MHILFVIDSLNSGGAQRQMVTLALGLREQGHMVSFFCYFDYDFFGEVLRQANVPIHLYPKKSRYSLDVIFRLRRQIQIGGYDLVLSFLSTPNLYTIIATRLLRKRPFVVISERFLNPFEAISFREKLVHQAYRFADFITVNSHHQREHLQKHYPWMRDQIATIYNGIDMTRFYPPDYEPPIDPFRLLVISSVSPYKNGLCLIHALVILRDEYGLRPQISWVGQHNKSIESRRTYLEQMEAAIDTHQTRNQWVWLHQRDDILNLMHTHHALVHPSYGEGLPNVVCEALACGRPVIVSNVLDHPRLVQDGISGFLFEWNNPRDLALAILKLFNLSPSERQEMGLQGVQFARQKLSVSVFVKAYEQLFINLLGKNL